MADDESGRMARRRWRSPYYDAELAFAILAGLDHALYDVFSRGGKAATPPYGRKEILRGLRVINRFLAFVGPRDDLGSRLPDDRSMRALNHLVRALDDLDDGVVDEILKPAERRGKTRDPSQRWLDRTSVCGAFRVLCHGGMTQREAAKWIAQQQEWTKALTSKRSPNLASTILDWERKLRGARGVRRRVAPVAEAAELYRSTEEMTAGLKGKRATAETFAKSILAALRMSR